MSLYLDISFLLLHTQAKSATKRVQQDMCCLSLSFTPGSKVHNVITAAVIALVCLRSDLTPLTEAAAVHSDLQIPKTLMQCHTNTFENLFSTN